ncbi:MAG TPA: hypothetical protein DEP35_12275 [Deltaproteobacteria bacterium]|jgi:predicted metal-binding membrane protein|nr:hypothetical protein [Deltaproteobacteria bacterium]
MSKDSAVLREVLAGWLALAVASALAWWVTLDQARAMADMPQCDGTMGLSFLPFVGTWTAMMTAMMLPSVAPVAIPWSRSIRRSARGTERVSRLALFAAGYLGAWAALGALAFAAEVATDALVLHAPRTAPWLGSAIYASAGAFQLTRWKDACLRHCRSPVGALAHYSGVRGPWRDLRVGVHHGIWCMGCCAGLMAVLIAVGLMNVPAMVALALVVFLEKTWRYGPALSRVAGVALLGGALLAPFHPGLLPGLAR